MSQEDSVFLSVPHYGAIEPEALPGLTFPTAERRLKVNLNGASLLAHNFNRLWCQALNDRAERQLTHFAMHHADIQAPPFWLDVLIDELRAHNADVVSAVIAIKDDRGLTTTGWQDPETLAITRFTMRQIHALPETFDASHLGSFYFAHCPKCGSQNVTRTVVMGASLLPPSGLDCRACRHQWNAATHDGKWLMVNTGLWVCRFDQPWVEEVCFEIRDQIVKCDDKKFRARVLSEDWNFSGWCARKGLKVMATRKVKAVHFGKHGYSNDRPWGQEGPDVGDVDKEIG